MFKLCFPFFLITACSVAFAQPPGKHWEAVAYNESTNELAVFSGAEFSDKKVQVTDSLWLFNGKWRLIDDNSITGRWAHGLIYHDDALYTYGGLVFNTQQEEQLLNDLHRFTGSWSKVTEGPKLSLPILFSSEGKLLLAGQLQENNRIVGVWELSGNTFQMRSSVTLDAEAEGLRALLVKKDIIAVYYSDSGLVFKRLSTGHTLTVKGLPRRTKYGITYNPNLDSYFLFGGMDEKNNLSNDLWQIKNDLAEKIVSTNVPSPRASCSLLSTGEGFILYGGAELSGKLSNEMWRYESGKWMRVKY
jgi:hypothetical protein